MSIQQQENAKEEIGKEVPTHGYNLRKCPTKHTEIVSMTQQEMSQEWKAIS